MKKKTLVFAGGGSGGHIRPLLGVAQEVKRIDPDIKIFYMGQKGDKFVRLAKDHPAIDATKLVFAGKFRRYHGLGLKQFLHLPTLLLNLRDMILVTIGLAQSCLFLRKNKPQAVFIKGGYIGVPVGLAAARRKIPIVTHDSDAMPGLANRLIAKWVDTHAVAMDIELYDYPEDDTIKVGVPLSEEYYSEQPKVEKAREELGLEDKPTVLVVGGSLGAKLVNEAVVEQLDELLKHAQVVHITGQSNYDNFKDIEKDGYVAVAFVEEGILKYLVSSDVVVSRAGATVIAEISAVGRPAVLVPNALLTGGHQLKNAEAFADSGAGRVVREDDISRLSQEVVELLNISVKDRTAMLKAQKKSFVKDSSKLLADAVIDAMNRGGAR